MLLLDASMRVLYAYQEFLLFAKFVDLRLACTYIFDVIEPVEQAIFAKFIEFKCYSCAVSEFDILIL